MENNDKHANNTYRKLTLNVKNAPPGSNIIVELIPAGSQVFYSTGEAKDSSPGINIIAPAGVALPLNTFNITPKEVRLNTLSGGDSDTLSFAVNVFMEGASGIQMFKLRSRSSGTGVQITASVEGSTAQAVNDTPSNFEWNPSRSNDS